MEQFSNAGGANLDGAISNSATSITVKNAVNAPSSGTFRAMIDSEYLKVTAVSGLTWTVVRGDGGSTAATHADNATVDIIVTKEAIDSLVTVQASGTEVSNRRVINFTGAMVTDDSTNKRANVAISGGIPWENPVTSPVAGNFAWVNQGSATVTTTSKGALFLSAPALSGDSLKILKMAKPGTNWTVIMRFDATLLNVNFNSVGFIVRDSSASKIVNFSKGTTSLAINTYTNPTTYSATPFTVANELSDRSPWWKFQCSSGVVTWSRSVDGESWVPLTTYTLSSFLTTPDEIGFFANANNSSQGCGMLLQSWVASSP